MPALIGRLLGCLLRSARAGSVLDAIKPNKCNRR